MVQGEELCLNAPVEVAVSVEVKYNAGQWCEFGGRRGP